MLTFLILIERQWKERQPQNRPNSIGEYIGFNAERLIVPDYIPLYYSGAETRASIHTKDTVLRV